MTLNSRKFYIWLIGLGTVLGIYILYNLVSRTPPIDVEREFTGALTQEQMPEFGDERGEIGDAKVGTVTMARYRTEDREFGFARLLHKSGRRWEIEKPYMKVFQPALHCNITAAMGTVNVEMAAGSPSPKDARLDGGVTIHILPIEDKGVREGFIYLDDLVFVSDRSEFSTDGPVRFFSDQAEMIGKGLRLIYDEKIDQLVLLRIIDLDFIHFKEPTDKTPIAQDVKKPEDAPIVSKAPKARKQKQKEKIKPAQSPKAPVLEDEKYYKCVLSKNVAIEYGRQFIYADEVTINNLFLQDSQERGDSAPADRSSSVGAGPKADTKKTDIGPVPDRSETSESVSASDHPAETQPSADEYVDVHVTCENGILVLPMASTGAAESQKDQILFAKNNSQNVYAETDGNYERVHIRTSNSEDNPEANVLRAKRIDYDMLTEDTVAIGPVDFTQMVSLDDNEQGDGTLPVRITADRKARFLATSNEVIFEGNVVGWMLESGQDYEQTTRVFGERLITTLNNLKSDGAGEDSSRRIKHASVTGGVVKLGVVRTSPNDLWSGTELKCAQIDYDKSAEKVTATGPGLIKVDNSNALVQKKPGASSLDLKKPCYALIDNFDELQWFIDDERIIAEAKSQGIHIGYLPVESAGYGRPVSIDTSHIDIKLAGTSSQQSKISSLNASGGICYSEGDVYEFVGNELFYDGLNSTIHVQSKPGSACLLNGVFVDDIKYDLINGSVKADIAGAGALMMKSDK